MAVKRKGKKKKKINYKSVSVGYVLRTKIAYILIAIAFLTLSIKTLMITLNKGDEYSKAVLRTQSKRMETVSATRGQIWDRNGMVLAYNTKLYNIILDPSVMVKKGTSVIDSKKLDALCQLLRETMPDIVDVEEVREYMISNPSSKFYRYKKDLKEDQILAYAQAIKDRSDIPLKAVWFEDTFRREYPFGTFACDVIGSAKFDGGGELGIELYYNDLLTGTDGVEYQYVDGDNGTSIKKVEAVNGNNLALTIDYFIQSTAEKYVREYNEEYGSKATGVIVQNPKTGEIYAMVDYPNFDLNNIRDLSAVATPEEIAVMTDKDKEEVLSARWKNFCISTVYEPGSVIKPFTVATGLDEKVLNTNMKFVCDGYEAVGGFNIHCDRTWGHGEETLEETIMNSCNDALMQIAAIEGKEMLSSYQALFGFGQKTGIDAIGEELGLIIPLEKMQDVDLATNSFGQSMNTTMIQVSTGFCSLINGGYYYQPYLLKSVFNHRGELIKEASPTLLRRTITQETSDTLREFLYHTVEGGTAGLAKVEGYTVGGKTGTAEKIPRGENRFVLSFIGFAPIEDPQVVVYVVVDEPGDPANDHSPSAKEISSKIMTDILPYLNVKKNEVATDD